MEGVGFGYDGCGCWGDDWRMVVKVVYVKDIILVVGGGYCGRVGCVECFGVEVLC